MPLPLLQPAVPIETDEHIMRARRTAAKTRIGMGLTGIALILVWPKLLPHPLFGVLGFVTILGTAIVQLVTLRPAWLKIEESLAGLAAILIIGLGDQHVTTLTLLWLVAISSGVMARGGRVHWMGSLIVLGALALPVIREQHLGGEYAAMCAAVLGLLLTCGRLTRELNYLLAQARRQAENAETLLLAGDIAARMTDRAVPLAEEAIVAHAAPSRLSAEETASARDALAGWQQSTALVCARRGTRGARGARARLCKPGARVARSPAARHERVAEPVRAGTARSAHHGHAARRRRQPAG
jgi:hypothetical protein